MGGGGVARIPMIKSTMISSGWWFFTTHLKKYAQVKLDSSSPNFGVNIAKIFELRPPSHDIDAQAPSNSLEGKVKFGIPGASKM